jgi:hypothetical protein
MDLLANEKEVHLLSGITFKSLDEPGYVASV